MFLFLSKNIRNLTLCQEYCIFIYRQFIYNSSSSWRPLNVIQIQAWLYITLFWIWTSIIYCNVSLTVVLFGSSLVRILPCDAPAAVYWLEKCISKSLMFHQFITLITNSTELRPVWKLGRIKTMQSAGFYCELLF